MKARSSYLFTLFILALALALPAGAAEPIAPRGPVPEAAAHLEIEAARVRYLSHLDLLVFEQTVAGRVGGTTVEPAGGLDGAPVLAYVFPTSLEPTDVGFAGGEGVVALAITVHPDFDDTPLWDENGNRRYDDDGAVFHPHWVVLVPDERVAGGLAVAQIRQEQMAELLPPTHPGMPMLMDSPGFSVVLDGATLRVLVPAARAGGRTDFHYDAVSAYLEVSTGQDRPMLAVYKVFSVLSGDLSLPYSPKREK